MDRTELKEVLLATLDREGISPDQVTVGFGGAMVMFGLRESTNDIDLDVEEVVYDRYRDAGYPEEMGLLGPYISISNEVDIHAPPHVPVVMIDDIRCHHPKIVLEQYRVFQAHPDRKASKRDQDAKSCDMLEAYITQVEEYP